MNVAAIEIGQSFHRLPHFEKFWIGVGARVDLLDFPFPLGKELACGLFAAAAGGSLDNEMPVVAELGGVGDELEL